MEDLKWTAALDVGDELMNQEHQTLLEKMAQLASYNHRSLSKKDILFYYDDLVDYTKRHFRDEEAHMKTIGYGELEQHRRLHSGLLEALDRYREEFNTGVSGRFPSAVFDFFRTWIMTHILVVDKRYPPSSHESAHTGPPGQL